MKTLWIGYKKVIFLIMLTILKFTNKLSFCRRDADTDTDLSGSQSDSQVINSADESSDVREGRALTIWTTSFSTLTVTTTAYVSGTTVTISALCSVPSMAASCFGRK